MKKIIKLQKKKFGIPAPKAVVCHLQPGLATINCHQSVKQSANYQTAEAGYSITVTVASEPKVIKLAMAQLETQVEDFLVAKMREHRKLITSMTTETKVSDDE